MMKEKTKICLKIFVVLIFISCIFLFFACEEENENTELPDAPEEWEDVVNPPQIELTQRERLVNVLMEYGDYNDGEYNLPHNMLASNGVMFYNMISLHEESGTILIETSSSFEGYSIEIVFYLYEERDEGFIMTNFYSGNDIALIGMGEVQYEGFMTNDDFTFSDVFGATSLATSVETLTITALQVAITDIDNYLSQLDPNLNFVLMWF